jgi:hypothetical protein
MGTSLAFVLLSIVLVPSGQDGAATDAPPEPTVITAPGGAVLEVPADWAKVEPKSRIVEHEFEVTLQPEGEDDAEAKEGEESAAKARLTFMAAGGDIQANIDRWIGQFIPSKDGDDEASKPKQEEKEIAQRKVYMVDLHGTYKESMGGGPFAPGKVVEREGYRMLAAIIVDADDSKYFIKLVGPNDVVTGNEDAFKAMIEGIKGVE